MDKKIYSMLNDVKTDMDNYENIEMTQEEKNQILNNDILKYKLFKENKEMSNKNKMGKRFLTTAAAAAIVVTASLGSASAFATTNPIAHSIADMFGLNNNLSDYATVLNQAETKDDITVNISEVVYDRENNKVIVATSVTGDDTTIKEGTLWSPHLRLYIDGEHMNTAQQTSAKKVDENTMEFVNVFMLKDKFEGDMDVNLKVAGVDVNDEYIKESWEFKFTTNGDELSQNTSTYEIGLPVEVGNGESLVVETLTINPISTSIFYSTENLLFDNSFKVMGVDNLGNEVTFHSAPIVEGGYGGEFLINNSEYTLTEEVESFTLQVCANNINPDDNGEFVAISEEFVVTIK